MARRRCVPPPTPGWVAAPKSPCEPTCQLDIHIPRCQQPSSPSWRETRHLCSADGSTHTEGNKLYRNELYRKVKHRYRPNISPRQRPTAKARPDQAAFATSAEARGATHRARPRSPSRKVCSRIPVTQPQEHEYRTPPGEPCIRQEHVHMQGECIHKAG